MLDLLPHEWEVLTMIDGERDLRAIAASLGRDEFEIAKIAYGLVTTGVIGWRPCDGAGVRRRRSTRAATARVTPSRPARRRGDELRRAMRTIR